MASQAGGSQLNPYTSHAAHVMILTKTNSWLFGRIEMKGFALMHLRFDGTMGFPGGLVDPGENVLTAMNRELAEELGVKPGFCVESDFLKSYYYKPNNVTLHFYTKLVTEKEFYEIEKAGLTAKEYGHEVLGNVRVPLYNYGRDYGFTSFLKHNLIGIAEEQLIDGLKRHNMCPQLPAPVQPEPVSKHYKVRVRVTEK